MSHFYASIKGNRGQVTRGGSKNSGICGHIRGWNLGIEVRGWIDKYGNDYFEVYKTGGSNNANKRVLIETIRRI